MSEYLDALRERRQEEKRLQPIRREAIRPLRKMLDGTGFGVRLPDVTIGRVYIVLESWSRVIAWGDCGDRRIVARLQFELLEDAEEWLARAYDGVVKP